MKRRAVRLQRVGAGQRATLLPPGLEATGRRGGLLLAVLAALLTRLQPNRTCSDQERSANTCAPQIDEQRQKDIRTALAACPYWPLLGGSGNANSSNRNCDRRRFFLALHSAQKANISERGVAECAYARSHGGTSE